MMKRLIAMLLAVVMVLSLVGCNVESQTIEAPNGMKLTKSEEYTVPTVRYAGTTIPVGLGLPLLTDEEIDALLAQNDPQKAKETITTLADFVNFCYRGEFTFGDGLIFFFEENGHGIQTTSSGYQTILRREGQCASMSSCLHYVLADDYEEVGYVMVDEHLMAYILCDGFYYLINPVDYAYYKGDWKTTWLDHLIYTETGEQPGDLVYCSEDFQDIADSIIGKEIGVPLTYIYTYSGPGDFLRAGFCTFPEGSNAKCWYGDEDVSYHAFTQYDWLSQEKIIDEEAIVMYPSAEGSRVTFGGVHWDVDTDTEWETPAEKIPEFTGEEVDSIIEYFKEIGAIRFSNAEVQALIAENDLDKICSEITTAEDCVQFIIASGIKEGRGGTIETAFVEKILYADKLIELSCMMLKGDYDEVGVITTLPDNFYYLYVKDGGTYHLYDVIRTTYTGLRHSMSASTLDDLVAKAVAERNGNSTTAQARPW